MLAKSTIRGRQSMALVSRLESVALTVALALLVESLDESESLDIFLLGVLMLHVITVLAAYFVVRHSTTSLEALRLLVASYLIMLLIDLVVLVARLLMLGHSHAPHRHRHLTALVRVVLSIVFIANDALGVFFTNMAQNSAYTLYYSNEELGVIAEHGLPKAMPPNSLNMLDQK
jgi:hypothetical protein